MSGIPLSNPYRVLLDLATNIEPVRESTIPMDMEKVTEVNQRILQLLHDRWSHPSNSKMNRIVRYYKMKGFQPGFLKELQNFKCKVCTLCKGARVYKHTKHVQEKMESKKQAKASKNWEQVLLETDLDDVEEEDELLQAFQNEELHMDYAHSIALGYNNERYYLLFVVGGRNFMWASPSTTRKEPEILLREFLSVTGLKICLLYTF